jgi:hypothetical protein
MYAPFDRRCWRILALHGWRMAYDEGQFIVVETPGLLHVVFFF